MNRPASTQRENQYRLRPFRVSNLSVPAKWDPSSEKLDVSYDITDPNGRIRSGRIVYSTLDWSTLNRVTLHKQRLTADQLQHGRCYEVPEPQRWDGTITEGLQNRVGQKVAADLAPFVVRVEVWNTNDPEPPDATSSASGSTSGPRPVVSHDMDTVAIDAIIEAKWKRDFAIPYDDPDQPENGEVAMEIKVRNVREGEAAKIRVFRIGDPKDASTDKTYTSTWTSKPEQQPGLHDLTVQGDKVLTSDGSDPYLRFNNYDEHWKYPGNNFYAFAVGFGDVGWSMTASERNYKDKSKRDKCCHLRYTVFIHCAATDLPEYTGYTNKLYNFLKNGTRWYRPFKMVGAPANLEDWVKHVRHRYMVFFLGHAGATCWQDDHPKHTSGRLNGKRKDMYHAGFVPDRNVCPTELIDSDEARAMIQQDEVQYRQTFGGCGKKPKVSHDCCLNKSRDPVRHYVQNGPDRTKLLCLIARSGGSEWKKIDIASTMPRLLFWNGGCRTMLTTNMGEFITGGASQYYTGWEYSPACDYGKFCYSTMHRYIRGTKKDRVIDPDTGEIIEDQLDRLVRAYRYEAQRGKRPKYYPRIMDKTGMLNARPATNATERALQ